jgi:hypothetical protein
MKTLTVRLPESLVSQIEAEARARKVPKSDIVRERLTVASGSSGALPASLEAIADLMGSVEGLPADLSTAKKKYLKAALYGRKRPR